MRTNWFLGTTLVAISVIALACGSKKNNEAQASDAQKTAQEAGKKIMVDVKQSAIYWKGFKPGGSHHGSLGIKSGELFVENNQLKSGSFVIDMNSIADIDLTDNAMKEKLVGHLKSPDFFDAAKYPESKFTITKVEELQNQPNAMTHRISGNLQMKGVEKNITFDAKVSQEGDIYKATTAAFSIDRTQWGVNYGSKNVFKNLADSFINDDMEISITIVTQK